MERVGFYGGCFNPPTNAHIELAQKVIEQNNLDKLYFVPVGNKYSKNCLADAIKRVYMLNLAIKKHSKMDVLEIEIYQEKNLKANEVFKMIQNKFDKTQNFFIMGADNFINIEKWENAEDLIGNFKYIILERDGIDLRNYIQRSKLITKNNKNFKILENVRINMSSSLVRELIEKRQYQELQRYMNPEVIKYIIDNKMYNLKA